MLKMTSPPLQFLHYAYILYEYLLSGNIVILILVGILSILIYHFKRNVFTKRDIAYSLISYPEGILSFLVSYFERNVFIGRTCMKPYIARSFVSLCIV